MVEQAAVNRCVVGSSPTIPAVAVAELAMQRIVVPRGEILYVGSSPIGHLYVPVVKLVNTCG